MTARKISGSIRQCSIDGISYDIIADANITEKISLYENSSIATSGSNMRKMVRQALEREGFVIAIDADEKVLLKAVSESLEDVQLYYMDAAGNGYRALGWINFESNETEDARATVKLCPRTDWAVTVAEQ